jgi:hypothetical protein
MVQREKDRWIVREKSSVEIDEGTKRRKRKEKNEIT